MLRFALILINACHKHAPTEADAVLICRLLIQVTHLMPPSLNCTRLNSPFMGLSPPSLE